MASTLRQGKRRALSASKTHTLGDQGRAATGDMSPQHETTPLLGHLPINGHTVQSLHKLQDHSSPVVRYPARALDTVWKVLKTNPVNLLLVAVPLGLIAGKLEWSPEVVFTLNFLAIIPLAALLSFATEEVSAKVGETIGGLLNASFGNAVELIVSIIALREGQIRIVQSSMLGSILSNTLLVLGCCFVAGGVHRQEQQFNMTVAQVMSSLMAVAATSLMIPATLYAVMIRDSPTTDKDVMVLSRGTSIILLILYVLFLYFQLYSHKNLFNQASSSDSDEEAQGSNNNDDEEEEEHILSAPWAICWLIGCTVLVSFCADYLVDSIDSIVQTTGISKTFIGLILIPIVGNAAEHVTAVVVSYKNKMDLAIGVSIGSSLQIALLITPLLVILGWAIGQPMTLHFETFETVVLFLSVLIVNYLIQDGKSNYLEGAMCIGVYVIIALAFFVYDDEAASSTPSWLPRIG